MDRLRHNDPEIIGPYKVIARLGSGGMGVVFLGTRGVDRAAIKVVRSTFLDDPSLNTRFFREIETLKRIDSPFVAKIVDSSIDDELIWHAVEFINGPTLRELIDTNGPLSEDAWWELAQQLGEALNSVHALGIVHRDIKPANIIMSDKGPIIIDFGIAQDSDVTSLTTTGAVSGSPAWLSPEQLEGTEIGAGSDLFSLGSVLVFAATGRSPWGDETALSVPVVYQKILSGQPNLEGLSGSQQNLVTALQAGNSINRSFRSDLLAGPGNFLNPTTAPRDLINQEVSAVGASKPSVVSLLRSLARFGAAGKASRKKVGVAAGLGVLALGVVAGVNGFASVDQNIDSDDSFSVVAAGPGEEAAAAGEQYQAAAGEQYQVVALLQQSEEQWYASALVPAMKEKAEELGIFLTIRNLDWSQERQDPECKKAVAAEPDGIILWPVWGDDATGFSHHRSCLEAANAAGIPVWVTVADVDDKDRALTHGYSGPDHFGQGAASAEMMCALAAGAKIGIIQIGGVWMGPGRDPDYLKRGNGFKETIASQCPNVSILEAGGLREDRYGSQWIASSYVSAAGVQNVKGMFAVDDMMVAGGIDGLRSHGLDPENLFITSIGNTFDGNYLVAQGWLSGTVFQSPSWDGENAVLGIYRAMTGDTDLGRDDAGSVLHMPNTKVTILNVNDPSVAPEWPGSEWGN